jgi:hypothetical protein
MTIPNPVSEVFDMPLPNIPNVELGEEWEVIVNGN